MNFHVMYNDVCICALFPRKKGAHTHAEGKVGPLVSMPLIQRTTAELNPEPVPSSQF